MRQSPCWAQTSRACALAATSRAERSSCPGRTPNHSDGWAATLPSFRRQPQRRAQRHRPRHVAAKDPCLNRSAIASTKTQQSAEREIPQDGLAKRHSAGIDGTKTEQHADGTYRGVGLRVLGATQSRQTHFILDFAKKSLKSTGSNCRSVRDLVKLNLFDSS